MDDKKDKDMLSKACGKIIPSAILLVLVSGVVFVLWDKSADFSQHPITKNTLIENSRPKEIPTTPMTGETGKYEQLAFPDNTLDTSGWKTYRNEKFGFEVKYPTGWEIDFFEYEYPSQQGFLGEFSVFPRGVRNTKNKVSMFHIQNLSLEEQTERLVKSEVAVLKDKKNIKINNAYGVEYVVIGEDTNTYRGLILSQKEKTFRFVLPEESVEYVKEFQKILLSFKFLQ